MSDIFGRVDQVYGGGLSADSLFMTWPALIGAGGGVGLLVQNVSIQYSQPVRKIYELGPGTTAPDGSHAQYVYYIVGRPDGSFQMARIFGFRTVSESFYSTYGNPCNQTPDLSLTSTAGCNGVLPAGSEPTTWQMNGVLLNGIAMNAGAQEMLIQESVAAQFISLDILTE